MDFRKRFFRRPLTTVLWLTLVIVMTAFLCVGTGLWYSSANLTGIMDELHTAIAVRTDIGATGRPIEGGAAWTFEDRSLTQEDLDALESLDSVKAVRFHTLTAGCSPELRSSLGIRVGLNGSYDAYTACNESYSRVMLTATIEKIAAIEEADFGALAEMGMSHAYYALRIDQILLAHEGFRIEQVTSDDPDTPENEEGLLHLSLSADTALLGDYFREGQKYIFYLNYSPDEACPCGNDMFRIGSAPHVSAYYSDVGTVENGTLYTVNLNRHSDPDCEPEVLAAPLNGTAEEFLADPVNADWVEAMELWDTVQHSLPVIGTENLESIYTFLSHETSMVEGRIFTQEEYDQGARVCILSQTLARENGIRVGDTIRLSQYLCGNDRYTNPTVWQDVDGKLNDPGIGRITYTPEFLTQDEAFTVVGLYLSSNEWANTSYSFTPNTIFIPKSAQPEGAFGGIDYTASSLVTEIYDDGTQEERVVDAHYPGGNYGIYLTIELKNGHMDNFLGQIQDTRLAGQFYTVDQGFEKAYQSIEAVMESAAQVMLMVAAGWLLLLALYVLLYQGSQKRNLGIMRSLGASPKRAGNYLLGSGTALAAVGVAIGTIISGAVFRVVQSRILETTLSQVETTAYSTGTGLTPELLADMAASSQFSIPMLLVLSLAQLAVIAAVLWLQARTLAKKEPRRLLGV